MLESSFQLGLLTHSFQLFVARSKRVAGDKFHRKAREAPVLGVPESKIL